MNDYQILHNAPEGAAKNPDAVLEQAIGHYEKVLILGWDKDGFFRCESLV